MKKEPTDLVVQLRRRNEKALYQLVDAYGGLIKSVVRKHVRPDAYEECMDDILLAIWNHIDKFDEERGTFKNWVMAVAKYNAISYQRKYYREIKYRSLMNENRYELSGLPQVNHDRISTEMEQLLAHLNQGDQELLVKHYVQETSIEEIAQDMGVKKSWIYNRLSRARSKLRATLKNDQS